MLRGSDEKWKAPPHVSLSYWKLLHRSPWAALLHRSPWATPLHRSPFPTPLHRSPFPTPLYRSPFPTPLHRSPFPIPFHRSPFPTPVPSSLPCLPTQRSWSWAATRPPTCPWSSAWSAIATTHSESKRSKRGQNYFSPKLFGIFKICFFHGKEHEKAHQDH